MTHFPMTERYDLLISSMRAASHTVLIVFIAAMLALAFRWVVRWLVKPDYVTDLFRRWIYNLADLLLVAVPMILIVISK